METNDERNNANEHNMVKNPNWQEADQLAIYKHGRGVELGSTKKLNTQASGQCRTRTRNPSTRLPYLLFCLNAFHFGKKGSILLCRLY